MLQYLGRGYQSCHIVVVKVITEYIILSENVACCLPHVAWLMLQKPTSQVQFLVAWFYLTASHFTYRTKKENTVERLSNTMNIHDLQLLTGGQNAQSNPTVRHVCGGGNVQHVLLYAPTTYNNFLYLWMVHFLVISTLHSNAGSGFTWM